VFIFTWVFEAGIIPNYIVNNALHLVDNPLIMILPSMIGTQFLIITKAFIESMPYELEEAARIDGASDFQIMAIIYLPLSKTILATVGLFHAVGNWNSYITPVIYLKNPRFTTIQLVLKSLVITMTDSANDAFNTHMQNGVTLLPANLQASAIFTAILPIVCVYPLVQKYFRRGILLGSVKG
jgi:putative aldouronate transport system permease protein